MADHFQNLADAPDFQARRLVAVTPHDTNDLAYVTKAVYIGTGGTISIIAADDTVAVSLTVQDGAVLPIRAKRIRATGTTATDIVGMS